MFAAFAADAYLCGPVPGAYKIHRLKRRKLFMDKRPLNARRRIDTGHFTINRQSFERIAARNGGAYGISTESVYQGHGQRRYRGAKTAAEDDACYDAGDVRIHIL